MTSRRSFLASLAALPVAAKLLPQATPAAAHRAASLAYATAKPPGVISLASLSEVLKRTYNYESYIAPSNIELHREALEDWRKAQIRARIARPLSPRPLPE